MGPTAATVHWPPPGPERRGSGAGPYLLLQRCFQVLAELPLRAA
jgi:hypothetical protein